MNTLDQIREILSIDENRGCWSHDRLTLAQYEPYTEKIAVAVDRMAVMVANLRFKAYAVSCGHKIDHRVKVSGKGIRKFTVHKNASMVLDGLRYQIAEFQEVDDALQKDGGGGVWAQVYGFMNDFYFKKFDQLVQDELDKLVIDAASLKKATETVAASMARSQAMSAVAAERQRLIRLADVMRESNYSKEEVTEAWEMSQVERVIES